MNKHTNYAHTSICTFIAACCAASSLYADVPDPAAFDINRDGKLSADEARSMFKAIASAKPTSIDTDNDGIVSDLEELEYQKKIDAAIKFDMGEFEDESKKPGGDSVANIRDVIGWKGPQRELPKYFHLRGSVDDLTKKLNKSSRATFSFTRDFATDENVWVANGAIGFTRSFADKKHNNTQTPAPSDTQFVLSDYLIVPSIDFNRVVADNEDDEVSSLVFRTRAEFEFAGGKLFDLQYFRFGPSYATDFDFEASTAGLDFQWEPVALQYGIGVTREDPLHIFEYRLRPILHFEAGEVLDNGDDETSEEDEFVRLGTKLKLEIFPKIEGRPLSFFAEWIGLAGLTDWGDTIDHLDLGGSYSFDPSGNVVLSVKYSHGEIPMSNEFEKVLTIGLGIRF